MPTRTNWLVVCCLLLALVLSLALGGLADDTDPIKIGVLLPFSGPYAMFGEQIYNGMMLGFEYLTDNTMEVIGRPLEFVTADTQADPNVANRQARKLILENEVDMLVGAVSSTVTLQLMGLVEMYQIPLIVPGSTGPSITRENCNWYTMRPIPHMAMNVVEATPGGERYFLFGVDYSAGREVVAFTKAALTDAGRTIVGEMYAPFGTTDFSPYLPAIAAAGADVLLTYFTGADEITLKKQIHDFGLDQMMIIGGWNIDISLMRAIGENLVGYLSGTTYAFNLAETELNQWYVEQWRERWQDLPGAYGDAAFTTASVIFQALEETGTTDANTLIRAWEGMVVKKTLVGDDVVFIRACDHQAYIPIFIYEIVASDEWTEYGLSIVKSKIGMVSAEDIAAMFPCEGTGCTMHPPEE